MVESRSKLQIFVSALPKMKETINQFKELAEELRKANTEIGKRKSDFDRLEGMTLK